MSPSLSGLIFIWKLKNCFFLNYLAKRGRKYVQRVEFFIIFITTNNKIILELLAQNFQIIVIYTNNIYIKARLWMLY